MPPLLLSHAAKGHAYHARARAQNAAWALAGSELSWPRRFISRWKSAARDSGTMISKVTTVVPGRTLARQFPLLLLSRVLSLLLLLVADSALLLLVPPPVVPLTEEEETAGGEGVPAVTCNARRRRAGGGREGDADDDVDDVSSCASSNSAMLWPGE